MTNIMQAGFRGLLFFLSMIVMFSQCSKEKQGQNGEEITQAAFDDLFPVVSKNVVIIPTMSSVVTDSNTVHCSNIEYLWNEIRRQSDQQIVNNALVEALNQSNTWMHSMDTNKLVLAVGNPEVVYGSVIRQYLEKYHIEKEGLQPQGDTFWAYTDKLISYRYAEPFTQRDLKFQQTDVSAFGFTSGIGTGQEKEYFQEQFDILYFSGEGEFIVRLNPANTTDEIILAMVQKEKTFLEMFNRSQRLIKAGESDVKREPHAHHLNEEDELIIPVIRFHAKRTYEALSGIKVSSRYGPIASADQDIHFSFDRKGVVLESAVSMVDSVGMPTPPKIMRYDRPFYLYIKEANAPYPYFNLWVANAGILENK